MSITKFKIASDIEAILTGLKPTDDTELDKEQIYDWIGDMYAGILHEWIVKDMNGEVPAGIWTTFRCQQVRKDISDCLPLVCDVGKEYYILLQDNNGEDLQILNLPNEAGVQVFKAGKLIDRVGNLQAYEMQKNIEFATSEESWYRNGNRIVLVGDEVYPSFVKFTVRVVLTNLAAIGENESLPIPAELVGIIKDAVLRKGMLALGIEQDNTNDAIDTKGKN